MLCSGRSWVDRFGRTLCIGEACKALGSRQVASASVEHASAGSAQSTIEFGKHKGKSFAEVCDSDPTYGQWAVKQSDKDPSPNLLAFGSFVLRERPEILSQAPERQRFSPKPGRYNEQNYRPQGQYQSNFQQWNQGQYQSNFQQRNQGQYQSNFQQRSTRASQQQVHSVLSGQRCVDFGKYNARTFADVFENDPGYCRWLVDLALEKNNSSGSTWPFVAYIQNRWLTDSPQGARHPQTFKMQAVKGCLRGCSFVITGRPAQMPRHVLEQLIEFFGGDVKTSVTSKTDYLILGKDHVGSPSIESGAKFAAAKKHDVPRIPVEELLEDLSSTTEEAQDSADVLTFEGGQPDVPAE